MVHPGYRSSPLLSTLGMVALAGAVAPMACRDDGNAPPIDDVTDVFDIYQDLYTFYCECYAAAYADEITEEECIAEYSGNEFASPEEIACLDAVLDANPAAFDVYRCQAEALRAYLGCRQAEGCPGSFTCGDGRSIPEDFVCDGEPDCADGSDEQQSCPPVPMCADGQPLDPFWVCDGFEDCGDGSDEVDCPPPFTCSDGTEVPPSAVCNGWEECPDGEDEDQNCPVTCDSQFDDREEACGEVSEEVAMLFNDCFDFACLSGLEIPREQVCDGTADCPDGDDEDGCSSMSAGG